MTDSSDDRDDSRHGIDGLPDQDGDVRHDRRRGGRRDVDPNLVGMLRGRFDPESAPADPVVPPAWSAGEFRRQCGDDLAPSRGIMRGVLIGACLWIWLAALAWMAYTMF